MNTHFSHDSVFWRRIAAVGAQHGPDWWVRYSPTVAGCVAALVVPRARRNVIGNLRRIRGEASKVRDAIDAARTFATYAGCMAEVLSTGSKNGRLPEAELLGRSHVLRAVDKGRGVIVATIHTGGWETVGPLFERLGLEVMLVMGAERDERARRLHDEARKATGLRIAHIGENPLDSLPVLRHLQKGGVAALQVDRFPPGMRTLKVSLLGAEGDVPLGPLLLSQLSGAPLVPIFCARVGYRRYQLQCHPAIELPRRANDAEMQGAAQKMADCVTAFLREHPTQWFHFGLERDR